MGLFSTRFSSHTWLFVVVLFCFLYCFFLLQFLINNVPQGKSSFKQKLVVVSFTVPEAFLSSGL